MSWVAGEAQRKTSRSRSWGSWPMCRRCEAEGSRGSGLAACFQQLRPARQSGADPAPSAARANSPGSCACHAAAQACDWGGQRPSRSQPSRWCQVHQGWRWHCQSRNQRLWRSCRPAWVVGQRQASRYASVVLFRQAAPEAPPALVRQGPLSRVCNRHTQPLGSSRHPGTTAASPTHIGGGAVQLRDDLSLLQLLPVAGHLLTVRGS